jgi:hypothetical protein
MIQSFGEQLDAAHDRSFGRDLALHGFLTPPAAQVSIRFLVPPTALPRCAIDAEGIAHLLYLFHFGMTKVKPLRCELRPTFVGEERCDYM